MKKLKIKPTYIAAFLTFACKYKCDYCINGKTSKRKHLKVNEWINGLNRLDVDRNLMTPITIQGGEPSGYKGWLEILNGLKSDLYIDILTNLDFDIEDFMREIPPERLQRNVPYASIRVSYHPESPDGIFAKIAEMQARGYDVGLFAVDHPKTDIEAIRTKSKAWGIDFRVKEFLGVYKKKLYGDYKYLNALKGKLKNVKCKSNELLIAPDGNIHKCHKELYQGLNPLGNLLDKDLKIEFKFRDCSTTMCNPCDNKIKNNRFQEFGTCAVEIKEGK